MLALKYRPLTFDDVVGQQEARLFLSHMTVKNTLPNLLIFDGVHGSGKTSCARIIGAAMNCENPPVPCGSCASCQDVFDGVSVAVTEIDAASHGKVADMEKLRESLFYSNGAGQRLVILDEAHAISREGFKSMLKTFEEAPPGVTFILITTEFRKIPETIVSRAMRFTFQRIPFDDIVSRLEHINLMEDLRMEEDLVTRIAEAANGSLRDGIMLMDKLSRVDVHNVKDFEQTTGAQDIGPKILQAMMAEGATGGLSVVSNIMKTTGDAEIVPEALTNLLKDIMLLRSGRPVARQGEALTVRANLAATLDPAIIMNCLRILWDIKTKFQHSEAYYEVYLAVAMMGDLFGKTPSAKISQSAERVTKASLSDLGSI